MDAGEAAGGSEARQPDEGNWRGRAEGSRDPAAKSAARRRSENAAMERREALRPTSLGAPRLNSAEKNGCAAWRSIPLAFGEGLKKCPAKAGKGYGAPGAFNNTGDDACPPHPEEPAEAKRRRASRRRGRPPISGLPEIGNIKSASRL